MATGQQWLFPPAKPLVKRLGKDFFRTVPNEPGVYFMRDATGKVLYVGKAKNLRQRLGSYRVANPERMPRRHLRMVREVARIDFELCRNESAALDHEARWIRRLKPKFNRAAVRPSKAQFLTWRFAEEAAHFSVHEIPPVGWERFGSLGGSAPRLLCALLRLLWLALNPQAGFSRLPYVWAQNRFPLPVRIVCGTGEKGIRLALENLFWGDLREFSGWVLASIEAKSSVFEQAAVLADLEEAQTVAAGYRDGKPQCNQLALL